MDPALRLLETSPAKTHRFRDWRGQEDLYEIPTEGELQTGSSQRGNFYRLELSYTLSE